MRLIDGDALIEQLDKRKTYEIMDGRNKAYGKGVRDAMRDVADAPTVATDNNVLGKWISVKDRLPDDASDVLAYYSFLDESRIVPVNYYKGVWYDCVFNRPVDDLDQRYITHWMSLPISPTE